MQAIKARMEENQVAVYLVAICLGIFLGVVAPAWTLLFERAITPVIAALIYTTFLQVPLVRLRNALPEVVLWLIAFDI